MCELLKIITKQPPRGGTLQSPRHPLPGIATVPLSFRERGGVLELSSFILPENLCQTSVLGFRAQGLGFWVWASCLES